MRTFCWAFIFWSWGCGELTGLGEGEETAGDGEFACMPLLFCNCCLIWFICTWGRICWPARPSCWLCIS
ncbi:hypothetical protein BpHYR1_020831 [Brachionus plicatilis]|uniref:Secreted protein n=1 Tax=Brachionus plicatilis TaxID=10195 RepID=A0A3M7R0C5_BRAPC|nr:hypothetical protein BpHYR1_020831 [Brachionus plicatilis]